LIVHCYINAENVKSLNFRSDSYYCVKQLQLQQMLEWSSTSFATNLKLITSVANGIIRDGAHVHMLTSQRL